MKWDQSQQYSHQEMEAMQEDAIRRVKQMQQRSEQALRHSPRAPSLFEPENPKPEEPSAPAKTTENNSSAAKPIHKTPPQPPQTNPGPQIFPQTSPPVPTFSLQKMLEASGLDRDQILILALIILFSSDGADQTLILALFYLFFQ